MIIDGKRRGGGRSVLSCGLALIGLLAVLACGEGDPDSPAISEPLRAALRQQDELEAAPCDARSLAGARAVRAQVRWLADLKLPGRRRATADSFWTRWQDHPERLLWIELAVYRRASLGDADLVDDRLASLAAPDSTHPAALFAQSLRHRRDDRRSSEYLRAAEARAGDLPPLDRAWLQLWLARRDAGEGADSLAVTRLTGGLAEAWELGGRALAARYWERVSYVCRLADRLEDALAAAEQSVSLAPHADDPTLEIRCRWELSRVLQDRGDYEAIARNERTLSDLSCARGDLPEANDASRRAAIALRSDGDYLGALDQSRRSRDLGLAAADSGRILIGDLSIAAAHLRLGHLDSARVWMARAQALDAADGAHDNAERIAAVQTMYLLQIGAYERADSLRAAVADILTPRLRLAFLFDSIQSGLESGRPDVVYRGLAEARALEPTFVRRRGYNPTLDLVHLSARFHARQGEFARAELELARAETLLADRGTLYAHWDQAQFSGEVAELSGDLASAADHYRTALVLADSLSFPDLANRSRVRLGEVLARQGDFATARALFARTAEAPEYWTRLASPLLQGEIELAAGRPREAIEHLAAAEELLRPDAPRDLEARLHLAEGRALAALGRPREAREALDRVALDGGAGRPLEAAEIIWAFNRSLSRELADAYCGLLHDHPELAGPEGAALETLRHAETARWRTDPAVPPPPVVRNATGARDPGSAVVGVFVGDERCFSWTGTSAGWDLRELPPRDDLLARVRAVEVDMASPERAVQRDEARALAELLLGPALAQWDGSRPLLILAPAELAGLPWAALPLGGNECVVDRGPVILGTAFSWLRRPPARGNARDGAPLLAVGFDAPAGSTRLRHAEAEVQDIAGGWPDGAATVLVGDEARWSELQVRDLARYAVIHVASHTRITMGSAGSTALWLAGGEGEIPLTLPEIRRLDLTADLVFLSCCEGARPGTGAGTGLDNLSRAFLQAGAACVVAATQPVDDAAARHLASAFYRHWLSGEGRAAALRAAQLEVRDAHAAWRHPFYWAHYQLHAAGAPAGD